MRKYIVRMKLGSTCVAYFFVSSLTPSPVLQVLSAIFHYNFVNEKTNNLEEECENHFLHVKIRWSEMSLAIKNAESKLFPKVWAKNCRNQVVDIISFLFIWNFASLIFQKIVDQIYKLSLNYFCPFLFNQKSNFFLK